MPGKLKMDEIAALTGYSVSTVSRVLSGKSYTSDKAREAIIALRAGTWRAGVHGERAAAD